MRADRFKVVKTNLFPRAFVTLDQRSFPVPLDKGKVGSGNEIGRKREGFCHVNVVRSSFSYWCETHSRIMKKAPYS